MQGTEHMLCKHLTLFPGETRVPSVSPGHRTDPRVQVTRGGLGQGVRPGEPLSATWEAVGYWWWLTKAKRIGHPVLCGQLPSIPALFTLTTAQDHLGKPTREAADSI